MFRGAVGGFRALVGGSGKHRGSGRGCGQRVFRAGGPSGSDGGFMVRDAGTKQREPAWEPGRSKRPHAGRPGWPRRAPPNPHPPKPGKNRKTIDSQLGFRLFWNSHCFSNFQNLFRDVFFPDFEDFPEFHGFQRILTVFDDLG